MRAPSFAGLILAAGYSSRMGTDKALLTWRKDTFLSSAIESLIPYTDFVLIVAGENSEKLRPIVDAHGGFLIRNPEPQRGQFSSLRIGLQEVLNRGRDAAIVTLVDRPAPNRETVAELKKQFLRGLNRAQSDDPASHRAADVWALVPEYEGKHGHPYIAGREMIEAFLRAPAHVTAREVEHSNQDHVAYYAVSDPNIVSNVDTPEEYARLKP